MQPSIDIKPSCDAMKTHGMKGAFFCTFSSKKATAQLLPNNYTQSISEKFTRCSFTGKERDEETGYGYFGARYMDHELMTMWLSVDPLADKYPGLSPYNYCLWNPMKLVDPNGQDTIFSFANKTSDNSYNKSSDRILKCLRNIGDSPILAIAMHGTSQKMLLAYSDGSSTTLITAKELANRIETMRDGSSIYLDNLEKNKLTIIVLYSCNTGNGDNCFGQQLSKELESSIVIAPVGLVRIKINQAGQTTIDNVLKIPTGIKLLPFVEVRCSWGVFYKGEKVMSFKGSAPQSWINKQGGVNKVIEQILRQNEQKD